MVDTNDDQKKNPFGSDRIIYVDPKTVTPLISYEGSHDAPQNLVDIINESGEEIRAETSRVLNEKHNAYVNGEIKLPIIEIGELILHNMRQSYQKRFGSSNAEI